MELQDVKAALIERMAVYQVTDVIPIGNVEACTTTAQFLTLLFSNNGNAEQVIQRNAVNGELLREWFGEQTLNENNVYTCGKVKIYGAQHYIVMGNCVATANSGASIDAYERSEITLRKASTLNAFHHVKYNACDNSKVLSVHGNDVSGVLNGEATACIGGCHTRVNAFENSKVKAKDATGEIIMHDYATLDAEANVSGVHLYEYSIGTLGEDCYGVGHDDCVMELTNNAHGDVYSSRWVVCRDCSSAEVYGDVRKVTLRDNSFCRIHEIGSTLYAMDNSTVQDYTNMYTNVYDNAVLVWMGKHRVFKNPRKFPSDTE